ncbi:MFS general substrate transporter [Cutaneotrichosporon oleaginosum]|uniref:MFS general substrate transporter n=1 Tax=Cutaneotrichosporon oleaginosum TaxID=879819 RepID=A0A0J1BA04_9TREE|nr:MFS general substrate transporter [Cutaneotrichosporon oleaginosum]KLT44704.1 MFS general substrate transporter [Cutaneotrichosporon oleaginosum]TXT07689.1 hypothetical protein COLE_04613 [Cutaneotrichosporon oleaginosum]
MLKDSSATLHMPDPYPEKHDDDDSTQPTLSLADAKTLAFTDPEPVTPSSDVGPPPNGGREAWLCAISGGWVTFCLMGFVCSFGQLQEFYLANQLAGYSKSTVAWIGSVQSCLVFFPSVIWGRVFDAYGARPLVRVGTTLAVAAVVAMAFCSHFYQFFLAHFLFGFASGIIWPTVTAIGGHWFSTKRGAAIGVIVGGSGLGSIIFPIMLKHLLQLLNFRDSLLIIAGLSAVLMAPAWVLVKSRLPKRRPVPWRRLAHPWTDARFTFFAIGCALYMFNWMSPLFNAPIIATANRVSTPVYDYAIAIMSAGSFLGRTLSGMMADKWGVWNVFGTTSFATVIVLLAFYVPCPIPEGALIVGYILYGWISGAWLTLVSAVIATISPVEEVGMRIGIAWSVCGPTMIAGPPICGALIAANNSKFTYAAIFCAATFLLASVLSIGPRMLEVTSHHYHKWRGTPEAPSPAPEDLV